VPAIFERRRGRLSSKISGCGQLAEWRFTLPCPVYSRKQTPNGKDRRVRFGSINGPWIVQQRLPLLPP
jgi:hypothetical protein